MRLALISKEMLSFQVSGELPGASPDHMMSPGAHGGKRVHPLPYISHSCILFYHHFFHFKILIISVTVFK